ncbi:ankyrin repeat domain-containing protein [Deinococcus misasensis]|uniref:ankyrin repeat domain-containing protein n=1 Tax=Deinococcus misasensis TaxID=392413 RepID=UPI000A06BD87|nr:ankyrin repeat domain-containing protein [Deinococcus misasensis]
MKLEEQNSFVMAAHHDLNKVQHLLQHQPELIHARASWNETPLGAAAHVGNKDIMQYLIEHGARPDICAWAALGELEAVQSTVQKHPECVRARGAHGLSVVFHAIMGGNFEVLQWLIQNGAPVNEPEGTLTPLHVAVVKGDRAMVEYLLQHGADRRTRDREGKTPLERAQLIGSKLVDLLR